MPSGTLSRERFRAIAAAERAAHAAEAKARLHKKKQKEALEAAAEIAEEVISQSGLLAEFAIEPLTEALHAATSANPSRVIELANQARVIAERMLEAMEDDEEDIMILIWAL